MRSGFSLVEVLVSVFLLTIVGWALISVFRVADIVWNADVGLLDLQQEVRYAMDGIVREARQSNPEQLTVSGAGSRLDFYIPASSSPIGYYLDNENLMREHPAGSANIVAADINTLTFCCIGGANCADCLNADMLEIGLSANKTVRGRNISFPLSGAMTEKVRLRN